MLLIMIWAPRQCISESVLLARFIDKLELVFIKELQPPGLPSTKILLGVEMLEWLVVCIEYGFFTLCIWLELFESCDYSQ